MTSGVPGRPLLWGGLLSGALLLIAAGIYLLTSG